MSPLVRIATVTEVPEGEARRFPIDADADVTGDGADPRADIPQVAVVNLGDGEFRALDAMCSHARAWLDEGEVDVDFETIECPKHGSTFDLETGSPRSLPATVPVRVYPVKLEGDDILIEVDEA